MIYAFSCTKIFGWTFDGLQITVQRYHCEDLYAAGRVEEATVALLKIHASEVTAEWVMSRYRDAYQVDANNVCSDLKKKCVEMLDGLGDTALRSGKHNEAIAWYTSALSLNPSNPIEILVKRSGARASKGLWEDALTDANEVCVLCRI